MANDLFSRIKQTVEQFKSQLPRHPAHPPQEQALPEQLSNTAFKYTEEQLGYVPAAQMITAIIKAGREKRLLYIRYKGVWRHIEPYELKQGKQGLLIYAWCLIDNSTHSFYIHKIQEMHFTDIPFTARFPIKV